MIMKRFDQSSKGTFLTANATATAYLINGAWSLSAPSLSYLTRLENVVQPIPSNGSKFSAAPLLLPVFVFQSYLRLVGTKKKGVERQIPGAQITVFGLEAVQKFA